MIFRVCPTCEGIKIAECPKCEGYGGVRDICECCNDEGKVPCPTCTDSEGEAQGRYAVLSGKEVEALDWLRNWRREEIPADVEPVLLQIDAAIEAEQTYRENKAQGVEQ